MHKMKYLLRSRANHRECTFPCRRRFFWTNAATTIIAIGILSIVSGFPLHHTFPVPSERDVNNERQRYNRQYSRLEGTLDGYVEDDDFKTVELNDVLSRRQTLATIAASTATYFSMPSAATAIEQNTAKTGASQSAPLGNMSSSELSKSKSKAKSSSSEPTSLQESISGFVAGAALAGIKTLVKFPLDTATVRVQMPNSEYSIRDPLVLFNNCFNGISLTLVSNIPAGAVFFSVKDAVKTAIKNSDEGTISSMPKWMSTSLAVGVALFPYWLVRNPSEVVKVRQQANIDGYGGDLSALAAVKQTVKISNENGVDSISVSELYTGYLENIFYAYPADVIKFVVYDSITKGRKDLSPVEGARAGALATALAQLVTTPLDVVRNRIMTGENGNGTSLSPEEKNKGYIESLISLGKKEGLRGLFAGATPRASKAILSGAIQFATYEETKQSMSKILLRR